MAQETRRIGSFNITPDVKIIRSLGQTGYSFWEAISELVDNAIDARQADVPLKVTISFDPPESNKVKSIHVRDNGKGMTLQELEKAMTLAYVDPTKTQQRLGKFGLGLKTACSSLGSKFTIMTKSNSNQKDEVYSITYDEKQFLKRNEWTIEPVITIDKSFPQGTLIIIENLEDRGQKVYQQKVDRMTEIFSMQYGPYIKSHELDIEISTLKVTDPTAHVRPFEYQLVDNEQYPLDFYVDKKHVTGWVGILVKGHEGVSKGSFGFNLYWHGRLVGLYKKIGFQEHAETWRIVGELHLDDFDVTHNKKDFIWTHKSMLRLTGPEKENQPEGTYYYKEGELYKQIGKYLARYKVSTKERRVATAKIRHAIMQQQLPMNVGKDLIKHLDEEKHRPVDILKQFNEELQKYEQKVAVNEPFEKATSTSIQTDKVLDKKELPTTSEVKYDLSSPEFTFTIREDGLPVKYQVVHATERAGKLEPEYMISRPDKTTILVKSNLDHPIVSNVEDLSQVYDRHSVEAIAVTLIQLREEDESFKHFLEVRDKIFREYFKQRNAIREKQELEKRKKEVEESSEPEL